MSELEKCMMALEQIGMQYVQKSMTDNRPRSAKIMKAHAIVEGSKTPAGAVLARRILQLQRQEAALMVYAPIAKAMGYESRDDDDDEWSSRFEGVDEEKELSDFSTEDIFAELKRRGYDVQEA